MGTKEMKDPAYERTPGMYGTVGSRHKHLATGHTIIHCGHPTALWPYYIELTDGRSVYAKHRHAFRHLSEAKAALEAIASGAEPIFCNMNSRWVEPGSIQWDEPIPNERNR